VEGVFFMKQIYILLTILIIGLAACTSSPTLEVTVESKREIEDTEIGETATSHEIQKVVYATSTNTTMPTPISTTQPTITSTPNISTVPTPTAMTYMGTVNADVVNLRREPNTESEIVGQVESGDTVTIIGRDEDSKWWQITSDKHEDVLAWIFAEFVNVKMPANAEISMSDSPFGEPNVAVVYDATGTNQAGGTMSGIPPAGNFETPKGINPLTGLALPSNKQNLRPVIVCINNDFVARPQYGTSKADVMYEYIMEGYFITRFSGVFYSDEADRIGPVRSARLINYYMAPLYEAALMCSGASDEVRYILKHEANFPYFDIDLDDPGNNVYSTSIGRDYRTRLQTSSAGFRQWMSEWHVEKSPKIRGFTFGDMPSGGVPAISVSVPYPRSSRVSYSYDSSKGRYLRYMGDVAHTDGGTNKQLMYENVLIQYASHQDTDIVEDSLGTVSIRINLFGSGQAILFRDGHAFKGTWQSSNSGDTPRVFDENGREVPFKTGKTWISVVPLNYVVDYSS